MLRSLWPILFGILIFSWRPAGAVEVFSDTQEDRSATGRIDTAAPESCNPQGEDASLPVTGLNCGGLVAAAGMAALKSGMPDSAWVKISPAISRVAPKILFPLAVISIPSTLYSVATVGANAFRKDRECRYDVQSKRGLLFLSQRNAELVNDAYKTWSATISARRFFPKLGEAQVAQMSIPETYLSEDFLNDLSCSRLHEILISKKRAQDRWVGQIIAAQSDFKDPRLEVTSSVQTELDDLARKFKCASRLKQAEIMCAAGNLILSGKSAASLRSSNSLVTRDQKVNPQGLPARTMSSASSEIKLKNQIFKVDKILGSGSEGVVYLVRDDKTTTAIKGFFDSGRMKKNLEALSIARSHGIPTPRVLAVDESRRLVQLEHIDGVPYDEVRKNWRNLGLDQRQFDDLEARFGALRRRAMELTFPNGFPLTSYRDFNVIFRFRDRNLFLVDPL